MYYFFSSSSLYDDDPGIMSEAETASTTRGKSRNSSSLRNNSIPTNGSMSRTPSQRSVQFRYPVAQFQNLFDDLDPGIMSEADTSSTSSRKRRQHQVCLHMIYSVISCLFTFIVYFIGNERERMSRKRWLQRRIRISSQSYAGNI